VEDVEHVDGGVFRWRDDIVPRIDLADIRSGEIGNRYQFGWWNRSYIPPKLQQDIKIAKDN
jgi:hypothetical protein